MNRNIKAQERALEQFRHDTEGKGSNFAQRVVGYVCDALGIERVRERVKKGPRGIVNARALGLSKHKPGKRKKKAKKAVRPWMARRRAARRFAEDSATSLGFSPRDARRVARYVLSSRRLAEVQP